MFNELIDELSELQEVESIALGGSRANEVYDEKSDYDVYLYVNNPIKEEVRLRILKKYCSIIEIGNHYWEYEDNCILNNGIDIDILYRNLDDFSNEISFVVDKHLAHNSYTTCMWHNLKTCKILFDRNGKLKKLKDKYDCPYPEELKVNIINRGMNLLHNSLPVFDKQILKASSRKDLNSVNHRVSEFLATYFDVIFALNELTHPGEKRLVSLAVNQCKILPKNFEENINQLFNSMFNNYNLLKMTLSEIVNELDKVINSSMS